ncbi:hypothetical protein DDW09_04450 [Sulfolobus sp. SCGC AB-777_L09]|nr:hypothetical protein DDW09_04450 [Sulfolobus sp. SCGC AB-777_L09]
MNSAVITLILILITVTLAVAVVGYYSSLSAITSNNLTPLQTAMELSKEIYISYSPPVISYITPTEPNIPLNLSVSTLVTLTLNFSGPLYVVPFLMKGNYDPYYYIPKGYYGGYINQISKVNYIGYVSVTGGGVIKEVTFQNTQVNLLTGSIAGISFYAFEVKPNSVLNVSFTTNASYVPVLWVLANISGQMFRLAYPVIEAQQYVNAYSGDVSSVVITTYGQLFEQYFGQYPLLFETGPASFVTFPGTNEIYVPGDIGYNDGGQGQLEFSGNDLIEANYLYYSPGTSITAPGHVQLPPSGSSNNIPYVPITDLLNPLYELYNPYENQTQLEHEANQIYNQYESQFQTDSTASISVSEPVTINTPTIFTHSVVFCTSAGSGPFNITFNAPVIFEGTVTDRGVDLTFNSLVIFNNTFTVPNVASITFNNITVFEGSVGISNNLNMVAKEGLLFNSSASSATITFSGSSIKIVSDGPTIMNLTGTSSSIVFSGHTFICQNSPVMSMNANRITFSGDTVIDSEYPLFLQTNGQTNGQTGCVAFSGNTVVQGGMVINGQSTNVRFSGTSQINIPNGNLIINTGPLSSSRTYTVFSGNSEINVNGQIAIQSYYITLSGTTTMTSDGYVIFYGEQISFSGTNNIHIQSGIANNYVNNQRIKYMLPLGLNSSAPLYMAGWFDVVPNNGSTTVVNALLTNQTYQVDISLNVKPVTPTEYNVTLYVNNTLKGYSSSNELLSANNKYMYVIEGYISGSNTCLELTIYSTSASTPVVTMNLQIPLPLNTGAIVEIGPETNYQFMIYSGTSSLTNLMLANGPYVNITNQLSNNLPNGISYLYYYYLIAPPVSSQVVLQPTYYYPSNGNILDLEVIGNSLV